VSKDGTYSYAQSVKSDVSDELINTYLLRPLAGLLVRALYPTAITPNQVTAAGIVWGLGSAVLYAIGTPVSILLAGLCLTTKDLCDSADGQLARAKQMYSRAGRFLDSTGDFLVNLLVFGAISYTLYTRTGDPIIILLGVSAFFGITLRVSYHVFYHTSFLHLQESYTLNRTREEMREEDHRVDRRTFRLHQVFLVLYGWQDRLMERIDTWCKGNLPNTRRVDERWYSNRVGLRASGVLGLGTELFLLTVCSVVNRLDTYLYLNLIGMNGIWLASIVYRRAILAYQVRSLPR
jgi:phosphatidylglycerophosphate synthase